MQPPLACSAFETQGGCPKQHFYHLQLIHTRRKKERLPLQLCGRGSPIPPPVGFPSLFPNSSPAPWKRATTGRNSTGAGSTASTEMQSEGNTFHQVALVVPFLKEVVRNACKSGTGAQLGKKAGNRRLSVSSASMRTTRDAHLFGHCFSALPSVSFPPLPCSATPRSLLKCRHPAPEMSGFWFLFPSSRSRESKPIGGLKRSGNQSDSPFSLPRGGDSMRAFG